MLNGIAPTLTLGANNATISAVLDGVAGLTRTATDTGTLTLSGPNTYSGVTTLSSGTTDCGERVGFGTSSLQLNGGILDLATASTVNAYNVTVGGDTTIASDVATLGNPGITQQLGTLAIGSNTLNITAGPNVLGSAPVVAFGATTLSGNAIFNSTSASLALGSVNGTGNLTLEGLAAGNTVGAITAVGGVTVNGGTWAPTGANNYRRHVDHGGHGERDGVGGELW